MSALGTCCGCVFLPDSHKDKGESYDRLYRIPPCKEDNPDPRRPKPWLRQDDKETFTTDL